MEDLGKLEWMDVREVWKDEPGEFTPWLAQNIDRLSEAIGVELELEATEAPVGEFAVDIVGTEVGSDRRVVIENQLEVTDHAHLGQLITYAAGRKARVVIWVSPHFNDAHRSALDWLNENSVQDVAFLGVQVRIARIGDSALAPHFEVVASPDEWARTTGGGGEASPLQERRREFFTRFLEVLNAQEPNITRAARGYPQSWFSLPVGRSGFGIAVAFGSGNKFRVELYIDTGDRDRNKDAFDELEADRTAIEEALGSPLTWQRLDAKRASRVLVEWDGEVIDLDAQEDELIEWGVQKAIAFHTTFAPRVRDL